MSYLVFGNFPFYETSGDAQSRFRRKVKPKDLKADGSKAQIVFKNAQRRRLRRKNK